MSDRGLAEAAVRECLQANEFVRTADFRCLPGNVEKLARAAFDDTTVILRKS
jgi:hypothetical protein